MRPWLKPLIQSLEAGRAAALVHVVELRGSGPREVGAQMLVTETDLYGTIGGGELEHTAIQKARATLDSGSAGLLRFALGPELGQCCGGAVTLAVESFAPADLAWVQKLARAAADFEPVMRTLRVGAPGSLQRDWSVAEVSTGYEARLTADSVVIREGMNGTASPVWLFGAGHVGCATIQALLPLGFEITWIDGRSGQFPEVPSQRVRTLALAMPELIVDEAPSGAVFLVMTHSHPLDEAICQAVLARGDFAYLGLIGSQTKRARFRQRLAAAGIAAGMLERMICPIGVPGIRSKEPAAIAASVAADLLMRREAQFTASKGDLLHGH
jgi:xanthine dehydrogenase accessory factor